MTDEELLELAAKAIGTTFVPVESWDEGAGWNPLEDDGDALRLAVKLKIKPDVCHGYTSAMWYAPHNCEVREKHNNDPYAATRRAIARAAAEIGKELK